MPSDTKFLTSAGAASPPPSRTPWINSTPSFKPDSKRRNLYAFRHKILDKRRQQTQAALLGKINSATLLQIHSQQDTNQLLLASIQQQLVAQKQQIDAQNRALNNAIYFQQNFPTLMQSINSGVSDSMHSLSLSVNGSN